MKRFIFAVILLFSVIIYNCVCLETVKKSKEELISMLDVISVYAESEKTLETAAECEKFAEAWLNEHHILCRIVRHEPLEHVTATAVGLAPLSRYGEKGELSAEILRCRIMIEEIWDSERPLFRNIF